MFTGYLALTLFGQFGEYISKNHALDITKFHSDWPKKEKKMFSRHQALEDEETAAKFECSCNSSCCMSTIEEWLVLTWPIQVENQSLIIQYKQEDV